jgi:hypothetical protein
VARRGTPPKGKGVGKSLIEDSDLDFEKDRRTANVKSRGAKTCPKLLHKLLFSKVLAAVKTSARELNRQDVKPEPGMAALTADEVGSPSRVAGAGR